MSAARSRALDEFKLRFGSAATFLVRSPGRVNLIGEHTDYNDGFVFPLAIERATYIALRARTDGKVSLHSIDFSQSAEFALATPANAVPEWAEYAKGVATLEIQHRYRDAWDHAADRTPHGSPIELRPEDFSPQP